MLFLAALFLGCAVTGFFYNNLSFARIRPALRQMLRQQKDRSVGVTQVRYENRLAYSAHVANRFVAFVGWLVVFVFVLVVIIVPPKSTMNLHEARLANRD